jgi:cytochrome c-type biogenesis protein CcmE
MGKVFISLVIVFIVCGGALVYQATRGTSSLVLTPSEILSKGASRDLKRIRVGGRVVDPITYQTEPQMILSFSVKNPAGGEGVVPVVYRGLKPDMFAAGRDVLIDGDYIGRSLQAAKLQTQCPSKYEPVVPGATAGEGTQVPQMPGVSQMIAQ